MSIAKILVAVGGGVAASVLDQKFASKAPTVAGVTLSPGLLAGLAVTVGAMAGLPIPVKRYLIPLAGGALAWEGTKLANERIVPKVFGSLGAAGVGYDMRQFPGQYPPLPSAVDFELQRAAGVLRNLG